MLELISHLTHLKIMQKITLRLIHQNGADIPWLFCARSDVRVIFLLSPRLIVARIYEVLLMYWPRTCSCSWLNSLVASLRDCSVQLIFKVNWLLQWFSITDARTTTQYEYHNKFLKRAIFKKKWFDCEQLFSHEACVPYKMLYVP